MSKFTVLASAGLAIALTAASIVPAEAGSRARSTSVQGSNGYGATRSTAVSRSATGAASTRSTQTNAGYGATTTRAATHSDGAYQSSSQTSFNNGTSIQRSASAQANGDGTASYNASRTGVNGQTATVSGTVSYTGPN